jgi:hypothetical protein
LLTPTFHGLTLARQNPARPDRPSGTRTPADGRRGQLATGGVGGATYQRQEAAAEDVGRPGSPPRRDQGWGGSGGGESGRAAASGTEMRIDEGGRWCGRARRRWETALHACQGGVTHREGAVRCVGEEWHGASEKRGSSGTGAARRDGDNDDDGEESWRRGEAIWGKTAKCRSGRRRGLYRTPTFCHGSYYQP